MQEVSHVVQEQTGYWSGVGAPRRAFQMVFSKCRSCLYDYTYEELQRQMELAVNTGNARAANVYRAFNPEQVAEIVEDYYTEYEKCQASSSSVSAITTTTTTTADPSLWYCDALRYYATQVTGGD